MTLQNKTDEEIAIETQDFILRLVCAPNLNRRQQVYGIAYQLLRLEQNKYFPDVFQRLDSDSLCSETKQLTDDQRELLMQGISLYSLRR